MKTWKVILGFLVLWTLAMVIAIQGCHTVEGVGKDLQEFGSFRQTKTME